MPQNASSTTLTSSLSPSQFEQQVTFTAMVADTGGPNPKTAPTGTVQFIADGSFGFGTQSLLALSSMVFHVQASSSVATYFGTNSFAPGMIVTITGFGGGFTQFNGTGLVIASASPTQFTINGAYTPQVLAAQDGVATSTSNSSCQAPTTALLVGTHTIVASYLGDAGHATSFNAPPLLQQVTAVAATNVVEVPGFSLIASFSSSGDGALAPQATLYAVPFHAAPGQSVNLLWNTLNVFYIRITGNNFVDYQAPPPPGSASGFDTGLISTAGSGIYVVGNGFTTNITLTLQAYDNTQAPILGLTSSTTILIS
jgi:hypothetical protein